MKKRIVSIVTSVMMLLTVFSFGGALTVSAAEGDVAVNATNFPDSAFREYVNTNHAGGDGVLSQNDINAATKVRVSSKSISSLKGIEYLTEVTEIYCSGNKLTSLDVSKNTKLTTLECGSNQLTSLNISGCTSLRVLTCFSNKITKLNLTNYAELEHLKCQNNEITYLDLSDTKIDTSQTFLSYLLIDNNPLVAVKGNSTITKNENRSDGTFTEKPYTTKAASIKLSDYGILEGSVSGLTGGTISNGVLTPAAVPGTVKYTYHLRGSGTPTINCTINFEKSAESTTPPTPTDTTKPDSSTQDSSTSSTPSSITVGKTSLTAFRLAKGDYDGVYAAWKKVSVPGYKVKYKVGYKQGSKSWKYKNTSKTNITIPKLSDGVKVQVSVQPYVTANNKTYKAAKVTSKTIYTLKKVAQLTPKKSSKKKVLVKWKKISGADGYTVYRAKSKSGKYTSVASFSSKKSSGSVKATKGKKYYYKVKAYKKIKIGSKTYKVYGPASSYKAYRLK